MLPCVFGNLQSSRRRHWLLPDARIRGKRVLGIEQTSPAVATHARVDTGGERWDVVGRALLLLLFLCSRQLSMLFQNSDTKQFDSNLYVWQMSVKLLHEKEMEFVFGTEKFLPRTTSEKRTSRMFCAVFRSASGIAQMKSNDVYRITLAIFVAGFVLLRNGITFFSDFPVMIWLGDITGMTVVLLLKNLTYLFSSVILQLNADYRL